MTWKEKVIDALENLGGVADLEEIYAYVELHSASYNLPKSYAAIIRRTIEEHSSDSQVFNNSQEDLLYSVDGIGNGRWGLRVKNNKL